MGMSRQFLWIAAAGLAAGCAIRLGGPKPVEYRTVAFDAGARTPPADVASLIRQADANLVLLAAAADSAWFGAVAREADLRLSGPGAAGDISFAFLAGEPVGDTTLVLPVEGGGEIVVHDALYQVDERRYLDLLAVRFSADAVPRAAVRSLLDYIATDVMQESAVVLAVDAPYAGTADSITDLLSPAFTDARSCLADDGATTAPSDWGMRLLFGPQYKLRCEEARPIGDQGPLLVRLILERY